MKIGHWHAGFRCRVSGDGRETARASLKPMLGEGLITPDNVPKKKELVP